MITRNEFSIQRNDLIDRLIIKAATLPGNRPLPPEHYASVEKVPSRGLPFTPDKILLVDDVVTGGSTFVGLIPRKRESFPDSEILSFALVRTMSKTEIGKMPDPIIGNTTFDGQLLHRHP